jgi:integral membrane sensor domain MASE1
MRHAQEPTYSFVILTLVLIIVNTALAWISVRFIPAGTSGASLVYIAVAFMILFTLWFGAYGAIAAYAGTLLAGVLGTANLMEHPEIAAIWAIAGLLQVLIPLAAVRIFEVDLTLANRRDWTIIILFAVLINNLAGAAWGAFTLTLLPGSTSTVASIFTTWLIGNVIVTLLIVPPALRFCSAKVQKSKLFVRHYWD